MPRQTPTRPFHAMAKPAGPDCNLACTYCFYREKEALYPSTPTHRMSDAVLEAYIRGYIGSTPQENEVPFTWQGGEPTLMGLDFYRRAVALQKRHGQGRNIANSFQTNGTLLNDEWCAFLKEHGFLVGLSLDGPPELHNPYRPTRGGGDSHAQVLRGLKLLQKHGVQYNVLACVNRATAMQPMQVYEFLKQAGVGFIQFIPVVERPAGPPYAARGFSLHGPGPGAASSGLPQPSPALLLNPARAASGPTTPWSVQPQDYGHFLSAIFDHWVRHDVGEVFVMNFEWALANFMDAPGAVCHHQPTCGRSVIVEHNGDVYACDHYVYPQYRLGNVQDAPFAAMLDAEGQENFGRNKTAALTRQCRECPVLRACWGGCPKLRFMASQDGEPGQHYLCAGFRQFFDHIAPYMQAFARLFASGSPASDIMHATLVLKDK